MDNLLPEWRLRWKNSDPEQTVEKISALLKLEGFDLQYEEYPLNYIPYHLI